MDPKMFPLVAKLGSPYILMHMQGTPAVMQKEPHYENVTQDILQHLIERIGKLRALGVKDIIIDPGFGFGKTLGHNFQLLKELHAFHILELPILAGISRKSMICRTLGIQPSEALNGTTALHMVALQQGASILRVHDVKEAVETIKLFQALEQVR
jgi:dihydropteroate synthase